MMGRLPKFETRLYFVLWFTIFAFIMYKVYEAGNEMRPRMYHGNFGGRTLFGREKDVSDHEWSMWCLYTRKILPWLLLHLIAAETARWFDPEAIPLSHFLITISFCFLHFPILVPLCYVLEFIFFFLILLFGGVKSVWFLGTLFIVGSQFLPLYRSMDYSMSSFIFSSFSWFHLRSISFVLSELPSKESPLKKFNLFLAYTFYLPSFFYGPLFPYDSFKKGIFRNYHNFNGVRLKTFCKDLIKIFILYLTIEILFHFLYCNAMHDSIRDLENVSMWAFDGLCICMAKLFYLKYLIYYGLPISIAKFELYESLPLPMCIFRVYLYSDMWRYFDRGFYLFIHRYIYKPLWKEGGGVLRCRLFASFVCFLFVYVWHGVSKTIFVWSMFNFVGITIETVGRKITKTDAYMRFTSLMSPANQRRINAIACSPFLILAIISNFIFFGGFEMGEIYTKQFFSGKPILTLSLLSVGYLMCQVSMEVNLYK